MALSSLCGLTAVHAFCLCAVLCVVNGHCLSVIQLCSLYLDCQVMSKRAYNLPPLSHHLHRWNGRENRSQVHVWLSSFPLFYFSCISGNATFHHVAKVVNCVLLNPVSPGLWQHLCVVGNGSLVCAPSELFEWNVFESLASVTLVEAVAVLFYSSSVT